MSDKLKQWGSLPRLVECRAVPLSFMLREPLKIVAGVAEATGKAVTRGHYGDAARGYCELLSRAKSKDTKRFADGFFYVLFGYESGNHPTCTEHMDASKYPFFYYNDGRFEDGTLDGTEKWAPGYQALLEKTK